MSMLAAARTCYAAHPYTAALAERVHTTLMVTVCTVAEACVVK